MWIPFDRRATTQPFPKPQWPPIQELDRLDIIGKRQDGGLDLAIVASQPLDDTPETLESIRHKVHTYLQAIALEKFQVEMGHPPLERTTIVIHCEHQIHPAAMAVIEKCKTLAAARGVRLEVHKSTG
jgi:hypothetical protein